MKHPQVRDLSRKLSISINQAKRVGRMLKKWDGQPISPQGMTSFQHCRDGEIGVNPVFPQTP
jgi:hypothetical protein